MQPLLNASKALQAVPTGFLKKVRAILKTHKNKLSLVTEADEPKNSSVVKPRRWNSFIIKLQNIKYKLLSLEPTTKKLT